MKNEQPIDRWELAEKLYGILGADLDYEEEKAIEQAIAIICPKYAEAIEQSIRESAEWYDSHTPEEMDEFVRQQMHELAPETEDGKVVKFKKNE